jgi:hypothetical protein
MPADREIIVPTSPRWPEFLSELGRARRCLGTVEHTRAVLGAMPGVDVDGSLHELERLGGTCDCIIELDLAGMVESLSA